MSHADEILALVRFALRNACLNKDQIEMAIMEMRHAGIIFLDGMAFGKLIQVDKSTTEQYEELMLERSQITDLTFTSELKTAS